MNFIISGFGKRHFCWPLFPIVCLHFLCWNGPMHRRSGNLCATKMKYLHTNVMKICSPDTLVSSHAWGLFF